MTVIAKLMVKCDVNDESEAIEIEKIVATAVAHYLNDAGHPGNVTVTLKSLTNQHHGVAGPQS